MQALKCLPKFSRPLRRCERIDSRRCTLLNFVRDVLEFRIYSHFLRLFAHLRRRRNKKVARRATSGTGGNNHRALKMRQEPTTSIARRTRCPQPLIARCIPVERHLISMRVFNARFPASSIPDVSRLATFLWPLRGLSSFQWPNSRWPHRGLCSFQWPNSRWPHRSLVRNSFAAFPHIRRQRRKDRRHARH